MNIEVFEKSLKLNASLFAHYITRVTDCHLLSDKDQVAFICKHSTARYRFRFL